MRKTKLINVRQYYAGTNLRPWSVQEAIKARVNKESWAMTEMPTPPLPKAPAPKLRLTEAVKAALRADLVDRWVMPLLP